MIFNRCGEKIVSDGKEFAVGDRIIATDSDYAGLKGCITEIRTGCDKDTENETDDIYCRFDLLESKEEIALLESHFSELFNEKKTINDISVDSIIMAACELRRLNANE